jgi:hypothetical protein
LRANRGGNGGGEAPAPLGFAERSLSKIGQGSFGSVYCGSSGSTSGWAFKLAESPYEERVSCADLAIGLSTVRANVIVETGLKRLPQHYTAAERLPALEAFLLSETGICQRSVLAMSHEDGCDAQEWSGPRIPGHALLGILQNAVMSTGTSPRAINPDLFGECSHLYRRHKEA